MMPDPLFYKLALQPQGNFYGKKEGHPGPKANQTPLRTNKQDIAPGGHTSTQRTAIARRGAS